MSAPPWQAVVLANAVANNGWTSADEAGTAKVTTGRPSGLYGQGRPHLDEPDLATDQKVIREACDKFLHYEENVNRALP
jgi:hypothetical protein